MQPIAELFKLGAVEISEKVAQGSGKEFRTLLKQMKDAAAQGGGDVLEIGGVKMTQANFATRAKAYVQFQWSKLKNAIGKLFNNKADEAAAPAAAATKGSGQATAEQAAQSSAGQASQTAASTAPKPSPVGKASDIRQATATGQTRHNLVFKDTHEARKGLIKFQDDDLLRQFDALDDKIIKELGYDHPLGDLLPQALKANTEATRTAAKSRQTLQQVEREVNQAIADKKVTGIQQERAWAEHAGSRN